MKHHIQNTTNPTCTREHSLVDPMTLHHIRQEVEHHGWVRLSEYDSSLDSFSALISKLCRFVTFDPARNTSSEVTQKVDAGTGAIGLHIENGNTPMPPNLVAFYCERAANAGSQTTVCDGAKLLKSMPKSLRDACSRAVIVRRRLPEKIWKSYVAKALSIAAPATATRQHLELFMKAIPGQSGVVGTDEELDYSLRIKPIITSPFGHVKAFANAILGPSFNYDAPTYTFEDGSPITPQLIQELTALAETCTEEVQWRDGEVVVIDNHRVMHGRRRITGDPHQRSLFIGMGNV